MFDILKNNDIVITNRKQAILNYLKESKKLLNLRIMSLNEFKASFFGTYNEEAIYYLTKKYNYKYNVAKNYLDNFLFNKKLFNELKENNLIIYEPLFKESIKRIIIDTDIDDYIKKELFSYEIIYLKGNIGNYKPIVYKAKLIEDEVNFVAIKISELLKKVDIDKIHLVNVSDEYNLIVKRIFNFYHIPINLQNKNSIYSYESTGQFIKSLKDTKNIENALEQISKDDIYNKIVDVCNKYLFKEIDDTIIYLIIEELKNTKITTNLLDKAVDIKDSVTNDDYYFILNFNQGIIPKIYKDEDFIKDKRKKELGILTSIEKNILEKNNLKNILTQYKNIIITYKEYDGDIKCYPSSLIEELNLEVNDIDDDNYSYSNLYNEIKLSRKLDQLIKFNIVDKDLSKLYNNYKNINYLKYDNSYKKIDKDLFYKYIDNKILLSYSSLDNYNRCAFRYYLSNVLKLDLYEETFMTFVGELFHYILSVAFKEDFDFEYEFNNYIKEKTLSQKEEFFLNKLKKDLIFTIDTIKKQDLNTSLNNALYEQKIYINHDKNIKITFMGVIDKLKYKKEDNQTIVAIIDYKTGNPNININNLPYGIEMQLPIYLYLAKNSKLENVKIAGFYLQKIVHNPLKYDKNKDYRTELEKKYLLEGYSNSDISILKELDKSYDDSKMIKSLKTSSNGFYAYSKILNDDEIEKINNLTLDKIKETENNIIEAKFDINPKKIGQKELGCEYCKFKDICFKKEEDVVYLKEYKDLSFLEE